MTFKRWFFKQLGLFLWTRTTMEFQNILTAATDDPIPAENGTYVQCGHMKHAFIFHEWSGDSRSLAYGCVQKTNMLTLEVAQ